MPVPIACTAFFGSDEGYGWSETHHISASTPVTDLLPFLTNFDALMNNQRRPLLARDCHLDGIRVAYRTGTGAIASSARRYQPSVYPTNTRKGSAPTIAAKLRMGELSNQQFSDVYLRGFWDEIEENEELQFTNAAGAAWKLLLDSYVNALVANQYGWLGILEVSTTRGRVTGYNVDINGIVTFTVDVTSGPGLGAVGELISVRVARLNGSNSTLNTTHIVEVTSATTFRTVQQTAALPFLSAGSYVAAEKDFLRYTGQQYTVLAKRSMGAPFGHTPGRRPARARR